MGQTFELEQHRRTNVEMPMVGVSTRAQAHADLSDLQAEVAQLRAQLTRLDELDTSVVLRMLSSQHARLREIQAHLWELNTHPPAQQFRSRQVEPLLSDTMVHFQIYSRLIAHMQQEWDISRGQ